MTAMRLRTIALVSCFAISSAYGLGLDDLSNKDASLGIKGALDQGAESAIGKLGVPGGFLNNPGV